MDVETGLDNVSNSESNEHLLAASLSGHDASNNKKSDSIKPSTGNHSLLDSTLTDKAKDASLFANYQNYTSELADKIKKVMWRIVPDVTTTSKPDSTATKSPDIAVNQNTPTPAVDTAQKVQKSATVSVVSKNNGTDNDSSGASRKESLFAKHMKKTKSDATPPLPKYVVLAVIDEGTGIPEGKREEVFSPFVRLQQKNKGSGLGLSLVSQIVTAHQGRIITDTLNGHTRFLVTIPVKHDPHYNYHD